MCTGADKIRFGTKIIYWNWQRQIRDDDYTIAGAAVTFSASHRAPSLDDSLVADYLVGS